MDNNEKKYVKKFDSDKEGIKILKVAAFCFAIISWIATAKGLHEYVFKNEYWQALVISFAIQAILFVFNLKLPIYFNRIGEKDKNRIPRKHIFRRKQEQNTNSFKWTAMQKLIAVFYLLILLSSAFFSFVYITNLVYRDTQYIDAHVTLDNIYRTYLNETEQYINELKKTTELTISDKLSVLYKTAPDDAKGITAKSKEELETDVEDKNNKYENCKTVTKSAQERFDNAKKTFETPMSERWRDSETYKIEKQNHEDTLKALEAARTAETNALTELNNAQRALNNYTPSLKTAVHEALVEILKPNPIPSKLNSSITEINKIVVQIDENGTTVTNFADIVVITQKLTIAIDDYIKLCAAMSSGTEDDTYTTQNTNNIENLKNELLVNDIIIPKFDSQGVEWKNAWRNRFRSLELIVKSIPQYTNASISEIENIDSVINVQILSNYDAQKIITQCNNISRSKLENINAIERAFDLLASDYPFLAWFSLVLALFFDISSLLAGLFIHSTSSTDILTHTEHNT